MGKSRILNLSKKGMLGAAAITALPVAAVLGTAGLTTPATAVGQEDKVTLSIATSCTFANTGGAVAQDGTFTASGLNGQEATFDNGGLHLFNVACNNLSGYTIRAYATDLQNNNIAEATIPFKDLAEYNASINGDYARWTASISGGNEGAVFGHESSDTKVIKSKSTPSAASGDTFSVTYKAYIGKTTTAGTYEGDAVYTLIMNPLTPTTYTWNIIYHADGSAAVPATQTGEVNLGETTTATISNLVPVKNGYHLAGWDTNSTATEVVYAPGATVNISQSNSQIHLYAVWSENATVPTTLVPGQSMQTATADQCRDTVTNTQISMVDERNVNSTGETKYYSYLVKKMADGNCWMVQNLALPGGTHITNEDSDLKETNTTGYNLPASNRGPSGTWNNSASTTYEYMWDGTHKDAETDTAPTANNNTTSVNMGAYYSFQTAIANSLDKSEGTNGKDAPESICPKGWKLPTGGANGKQWNTLADQYSAGSTFNTVFNVAFTGRCNSSDCPNAVSNAYYWSSSINSASYGYYLGTNSIDTNPSGNFKYNGYSVRCVLIGSPSN